jgi:hypothetical protein
MFIRLLLTIIHSNHHFLHFETVPTQEIFGIQNPAATEITLMPETSRVAGAIPDSNFFNTSVEGDGIATGKF